MRFAIITLLLLVTSPAVRARAMAANPDPFYRSTHQSQGLVREITADRHKTVIRHEAISGYMPAMTMEFNVRDTNQLQGVSPGDTVAFRLLTTDDTHWIDNIRKLSTVSGQETNGASRRLLPELKPGDPLPDFEFLTEQGNVVRFSDLRGKGVAITFFFTRCPLPDYCPRMSSHFSKARELIRKTPNAPTNWLFLSLSFDPEFDRPNVLSTYANLYCNDDHDGWMFAAVNSNSLAALAPGLDLMVRRGPDGSISHNLRTVVLDSEGRIWQQLDGNEWTPLQLVQALLGAAGRVHK